MKDVLEKILEHKKKEIAQQKEQVSYVELEKQLSNCGYPIYSLKSALLQSHSGIIAEFKRRSPSKNWINQFANAKIVAKDYENAGASAVSVLTDEQFFGGSLSDLKSVTSGVKIPVLRKEFIVDEYQILEARLSGASAILLIAAALTKEECKRFTKFATDLGLEVLLELHDENEVDYISSENSIIGINNRSLGTFVTDVQKSYSMIERLPKNAVLVSESGISKPQTVIELRNAGYKGFLIGENFMKTKNPGESLKNFIETVRTPSTYLL